METRVRLGSIGHERHVEWWKWGNKGLWEDGVSELQIAARKEDRSERRGELWNGEDERRKAYMYGRGEGTMPRREDTRSRLAK